MDTKKYNLENTIFAWSNQKGLDPIHVKKAEGVHPVSYTHLTLPPSDLV